MVTTTMAVWPIRRCSCRWFRCCFISYVDRPPPPVEGAEMKRYLANMHAFASHPTYERRRKALRERGIGVGHVWNGVEDRGGDKVREMTHVTCR
jgi:hypothetical protein